MDAEILQAQGWEAINPDSFSRALGTLWIKRGDPPVVGFVAGQDQCNAQMGTVHGAALMTLADLAFGFGVAAATGTYQSATAQLNLQFVAAPRIGDFIACHPEVVRVTKQIVFMRGLIRVGDKGVAHADGLWKLLTPRA